MGISINCCYLRRSATFGHLIITNLEQPENPRNYKVFLTIRILSKYNGASKISKLENIM